MWRRCFHSLIMNLSEDFVRHRYRVDELGRFDEGETERNVAKCVSEPILPFIGLWRYGSFSEVRETQA